MKSRFIKIRCKKCKNEQIIFENAASKINCLVCQELISTPTGGKSDIKATPLEAIG
tara:strand:+ start:4761 stop:4928 length:168 start_codon:yes stop_codon:yes gene_type:complete